VRRRGIFALFLILTGKLSFSPLNMILAVEFLQIFLESRKFPSIPSFLTVLMKTKCLILSNACPESTDMIISFFFFGL
jgi:hypothetical protein